MTGLTITLGIIGTLISLVCWYSFFGGIRAMVRTIMLGQPAPDRFFPLIPRLKTMLKEFIAHTRMAKFRTVGWAHWLVMVGFLLGAALWFEAYGQTYNPDFAWPIIGRTHLWLLLDELLGIGTVVGIIVLMIIRQNNHPRVPERLSRFAGSNFRAAYFVEWVVLLEGLGMIFVKTFKIAAGLETPPLWTSFFTENLAKLFTGIPVLVVSIAALVKLLSGMIWLLLVGRNITWGVAWHRLSAFFNIYFKREDDGDVALGAAKPMMSAGKVLDLEEADPDTDLFGAGKIEDFSWKALLDFTTCTECGRCQSQCPAWNTGKPLSPKLLIMSLRDHTYAKAPYLLSGGRKNISGEEVGLVDADGNPDEAKLAHIPQAARDEAERSLVGPTELDQWAQGGIIDPDVLWSCTTCGACVEQCPVDIEHVDHIIDMRRYQVLIESEFPHELSGLFKNLENKGNPWGQNSSARNSWINEVDFPVPVWGKDVDSFQGYEYLFWVGCAGAFEDRAKKTTKAVAELLNIAAVPYLVLGDGETCTGDSARRGGNELLFQTLAKQNIETLNDVFSSVTENKRKVVVTCAHCFNALSNEYPQLGAQYTVLHHTQLLNQLVREKRLIPVAPTEGNTVTYHDPCYLGRHNKIYSAPRDLINASGTTLVEMPRHGERSMCCGAGGARMWMEETLGKRINDDRVDEALSTSTQKIATGCPFCRVMLSDGATSKAASPDEVTEVVDVSQMLLESVKRGNPTINTKLIISKPPAEPEPAAEADAPAASGSTDAKGADADKTADAAKDSGATKADKPAKPQVGLGLKRTLKAPGGKADAKPDAQKAEATSEASPEASTSATPAKPQVGLGIKRPKKAPGTTSKPEAQTPSEEPKATPESEAPAKPATPAKPQVGLGIKRPKKAPGSAATPGTTATPDTTSEVKTPAEKPAEKTDTEGDSKPATTSTQADPASAEERASSAKPQVGLGIKRSIKAPGSATVKAPATASVNSNSAAGATQGNTAEVSQNHSKEPLNGKDSGNSAVEHVDHEASTANESRESQSDSPVDLNASNTKGLPIKLGARKPGSATD